MRTFSWILIFCWLQQQQQQHLAQARPQANEMHHNTSTITNQTWTTDNHTIDGKLKNKMLVNATKRKVVK